MSHYSFETPSPLRLRVENKLGDVYLLARPGSTTVVEVTGGGHSGEEMAGRTRVEHYAGSAQPDTIVVEVPNPQVLLRSLSSLGGWVAVRVELPEGTEVDISTAAGDIRADGAFGQAKLVSASGDIWAARIAGDFSANTASGDVGAGTVSGGTEVGTASGSVTLEMAQGPAHIRTASGDVTVQGSGGPVSVQTASGDVRIGEVLNGCQVKTASGDQELGRAVSGKARLETMSGDLRVGVPKGTAVSVELETITGALSSEIELSAERPGSQEGSRGAGADEPFLELSARTVTGDVKIKRLP
jgi:DUF4097 and DUF4098 domain-containing protein YvlB